MINVSFLLKKYYRFKSSLQKKLYICPVFNDIDHDDVYKRQLISRVSGWFFPWRNVKGLSVSELSLIHI